MIGISFSLKADYQDLSEQAMGFFGINIEGGEKQVAKRRSVIILDDACQRIAGLDGAFLGGC